MLADLGPLAPYLAVKFDDFSIFFIWPIFFFYFGIKLINKALSDLFSIFSSQHFRYELPILSKFFDQFFDGLILFWWPYFMSFSQLRQPSVSMKALIFVSICHKRCNLAPSLWKLFIKIEQLVVFIWIPCLHSSLCNLDVFLLDFHPHLLSLDWNDRDDKFLLHSSINDSIFIIG